ncbi:zinc finger protein RFP-like [Anolis sagrei]|uniref:zinc finger protein RFP-like n=1 Tax=Anolis sagrei TaxID=38937 RepID=UPI0035221209
MAAASAAENPWEEAICSICLDPVTLECGHNFWDTFLTQCWEKSADTDASCPFYWAKVLRKNLIKNWQIDNLVAAAKKLNPRYEGVKRGRQEPQKNDNEDNETTISVEYDRSKEQHDYRVISLGKAVQDCKNQCPRTQRRLLPSNWSEPQQGVPQFRRIKFGTN